MVKTTHPCGLSQQAVRQHETGSRLLRGAGLLAYNHYNECMRLREKIAEMSIRIDALSKARNATLHTAKDVLLEELYEQGHPEAVEDVIFWALEYYAMSRPSSRWGVIIANTIKDRILAIEGRAHVESPSKTVDDDEYQHKANRLARECISIRKCKCGEPVVDGYRCGTCDD